MKKFILWNIILIPTFFFGLFNVKADTGTYQYIGTIDNCTVNGTGILYDFGTNDNVLVYEIFGTDFSITFLSGTRLRISLSPILETTCGLNGNINSDVNFVLNISNPVVNQSYSFINNYLNHPHVYAYVNLSYQSNGGSSSWGTDLPPEPEPEPEPLTFDDLIYVPEDSTYNKCYVVQSEGVIRAYDVIPALSTNYNYRDYYINSSYIYKDGSGSWSQYSTLPICLDSDKLTNDFYYRLDFDKICIIFITLVLFGILLPIKIFSKILLGKGGL